MPKSYFLLPECILRPARVTDRVAIRMLLLRLSRLALPNYSLYQLSMLAVTIILVIIVILFLTFYLVKIIGVPDDRFGLIWDLVIMGILPFVFLYIIPSLSFQHHYSECRVVEYRGRLVALAVICDYSEFIAFKYIFVAPNHRKQGIGTYIIQNLMQQSTKPIYCQHCQCACGKALFYVRLGFVPIRLKQL